MQLALINKPRTRVALRDAPRDAPLDVPWDCRHHCKHHCGRYCRHHWLLCWRRTRHVGWKDAHRIGERSHYWIGVQGQIWMGKNFHRCWFCLWYWSLVLSVMGCWDGNADAWHCHCKGMLFVIPVLSVTKTKRSGGILCPIIWFKSRLVNPVVIRINSSPLVPSPNWILLLLGG